MTHSNQFALLRQRRFAPFFITQFLGAFNDNVFRNGLVILVTFQTIAIAGMDVSELANVAGALFILPFFLFSALAGQLADKFEKSRLIRAIKLLEICLMTIAAIALFTENYGWLLAVLFLMGCQSTLFGPVKYAYLPQTLATEELIGGNALVESGTYTAIILGLMVGGITVAVDPGNNTILAACLLGIASLGYLASRSIPTLHAVDPGLKFSWNTFSETWRIVGFARKDRNVFLAILGISWFWFLGSAITFQVPAYTLVILNGNESVTTVLLVAFAVGVGTGSLLCERMSGRHIELGLVPFGSIGLSVFCVDLYFAQPVSSIVAVDSIAEFLNQPGNWRILIDMALIGAFGGFYSVPLYAMLQSRASRQHLSRIIAANNIINSIFIVSAAVVALSLLKLGFSIPEFFLILAVLNALVASYIYTLLPEFLMRFLIWVIIHTFYRVRVSGLEQIPREGPAILVCNHVSYVDALIIGGYVPRPVRFVMWFKIFQIPLLRFIFRTARAIPIASARENEELLRQSFARIDEELSDGNIICLFPEGAITLDGHVHPFKPGIEKILEKRQVPVIPMALSGLWGSWFSRRRGRLRRFPGRLFKAVDLRIGEPVSPQLATARNLELLVRTLRGDYR